MAEEQVGFDLLYFLFKADLISPTNLVMFFSMTLLFVSVVLRWEKEPFDCAVCCECCCCDSKSWEGILESFASREVSGISPCLAVKVRHQHGNGRHGYQLTDVPMDRLLYGLKLQPGPSC